MKETELAKSKEIVKEHREVHQSCCGGQKRVEVSPKKTSRSEIQRRASPPDPEKGQEN